MRNPYIFGIRHLSPAGAWHLRQFLDEKKAKDCTGGRPGGF